MIRLKFSAAGRGLRSAYRRHGTGERNSRDGIHSFHFHWKHLSLLLEEIIRSVSGSYKVILTELSWAFLTQSLRLKGDWEGRGRG